VFNPEKLPLRSVKPICNSDPEKETCLFRHPSPGKILPVKSGYATVSTKQNIHTKNGILQGFSFHIKWHDLSSGLLSSPRNKN
jgi:hypothetical protein